MSTPEQVRQRFRSQGKTLSQWADEHGYPREAVYRVMGGVDKGHYGRSHEIALALGLKEGGPDILPARSSALQ